MSEETLLDVSFAGPVIEWRGPPPYYFVAIPEELVGEVAFAGRIASYGWGCVPAEATADGVEFGTALFPKDGGYLLPLKAAVRKAAGIAPDAVVQVRMRIVAPA